MATYTEAGARHLYNMAFALGLSGHELLQDSSVVVRECNGVGADWMPTAMRKLCTKLNAVMEIPAAIHDRRYVLGTTRADRQAADNEFLMNCTKIILNEYAWWNPWRYIMIRRAIRYTTYLQMFGGAAWEAAKKHG